ncbi:hypothetical protein [Acetobacter sp.]|uniref:hypothetical protein n=1 Tax=Acetobacter sp. TaxID=440 RepID=UPI0039EBB22C
MKLHHRLCAIMSLLPLLTAPSARAEEQGPVPGWMRGTWVAVEVRQAELPQRSFDPVAEYSGKPLTITAGEIRFRDLGCEVSDVKARTGRFDRAFVEGSGGLQPGKYGLPPERGSVAYYAVSCRHRLIIYEKGDDPTDPSAHTDKSDPTHWSIIVRSHAEIDIPYGGATYIRFRRQAEPTS